MSAPQIIPIILGVLAIATRLPGVIYPKKFSKVVLDMTADDKIMRLVSAGMTIFGALVILMWPYYTEGIYMIIPILGALIFFGAINIMWNPAEIYKKIIKPLMKSGDDKVRLMALAGVILGVLLVYIGYSY